MNNSETVVITVRFNCGSYTARARGEKATASSTITAEAAAKALAIKLGAGINQLDLFAASSHSLDPHLQFTAKRPTKEISA